MSWTVKDYDDRMELESEGECLASLDKKTREFELRAPLVGIDVSNAKVMLYEALLKQLYNKLSLS